MDFPFSFRRPAFSPLKSRRGLRVGGCAVAVLLLAPFWTLAQNAAIPEAPTPRAPQWKAAFTTGRPNGTLMFAASSPANPAAAGDVSLYTVVDLALRNSNKVRVAEAEVRVARGASKESRDAYIPNFSLGSGLGYSYGFPLGQPTIFTVTSNSLLFSFSQHDYIRSTRAAEKAATLSLKNVRQQVILDAALGYVDLAKTINQIAALRQATADTDRLLSVLSDRQRAGLETELQMTRARLTRAQIQLRAIRMENHADELRQHLSNLTGIDAGLIDPTAASVPPLPNLDFPTLLKTSPKPPAVLAADATADSKMFASWGDKRQNYRPTVQLAFQYALFSNFNNYTNYYNAKNFQYNNIGVGIQAVWPLFDPLRRDKAIESKAAAVRARRQAELARIQNDEGNLTLWHSLRELKAQEKVALLQQQLAQDTLAVTVTQMNRGAGSVKGAPIPPQVAEQQRIDERDRYVDLQDAQFQVTKTKLDLLNAVGGLEDWAKESSGTAEDANTAEKHVANH